MSKKLVGGTLGSILTDRPVIENGMMKVQARMLNIYPKIELNAMATNEPKKNLQHFMLETVVEASESYVYLSSRFIMDLDGEETLAQKFNEFIDYFAKQCEEVKKNYKD